MLNQMNDSRGLSIQQGDARKKSRWEIQEEFASLLRQCKCYSEGKIVHQRLQAAGLSEETFLGNSLLRMYGNFGSLEDAKSVFDQIRTRNVFTGNIMIAAYARHGHTDEARWIFDKMAERSTVSWNSIIAVYAHHGQPLEALHIFRKMILDGAKPNAVTLLSTIDACSSLSVMLDHGIKVHALAAASGLNRDVKVANALINMYGKHSRVREAKLVFDSMQRGCRDVISWNTLLAAYASNGQFAKAKRVFDEMQHSRNLVTWNTMISGYAQNGSGDAALLMLSFMDLEGEQPNVWTFVSVFDACAGVQALDQGRLIHLHLLDQSTDHRSISRVEIGNALIHMYGRCRCSRDAEATFAQMNCTNVVTWSSLIAAHVHAGDLDAGLTTFHRMNVDGVPPNDITFVAVLNACSHKGSVKQGWEFFVSLQKDFGIRACLDHVVCMVDMFGRAGLVEDAIKLVKSSEFWECSVPWMALLSACRSSDQTIAPSLKVGKKALDLNGAKSSAYILISNALCPKIEN